mgnify:CR=1 FL=1
MTESNDSRADDRERLIEPAYWATVVGFVFYGVMSWTGYHGYVQASSLFGALFVGFYLGGTVYLMVVGELSPTLSPAGDGL